MSEDPFDRIDPGAALRAAKAQQAAQRAALPALPLMTPDKLVKFEVVPPAVDEPLSKALPRLLKVRGALQYAADEVIPLIISMVGLTGEQQREVLAGYLMAVVEQIEAYFDRIPNWIQRPAFAFIRMGIDGIVNAAFDRFSKRGPDEA